MVRLGERLMVDGAVRTGMAVLGPDVVEGVGAVPGAVDELIDDDEVAGVEIRLE